MIQPSVLDNPLIAAKPRKRKRLYRVLWTLLALVVSVCSYWSWSYYSALAERDALIAELRARGEPVWWDEVAEKASAEQSDETGAELFMKALWELGGDYNSSKRGLPSLKLEDGLRAKFPEPTVLPEVQSELLQAAAAFAYAKHAVKYKPGLLTKRLKDDDPSSIRIPHVQTMRSLANAPLGRLRRACANDPRRAFHAVTLSLECSEQLAVEPFIITQTVRMANKAVACESLATCLSYAAPTEQEFRVLDGLLAAHDDGFGVDFAIIADRAARLELFENQFFRIYLFNWRPRGAPSRSPAHEWMYQRWLDVLASPFGRPPQIRTQSEAIRLTESMRNTIDRPEIEASQIQKIGDEYERRSPVHRMIENSHNFETEWVVSFSKWLARRIAVSSSPGSLSDCDGTTTNTTNSLNDSTNSAIARCPKSDSIGFRINRSSITIRTVVFGWNGLQRSWRKTTWIPRSRRWPSVIASTLNSKRFMQQSRCVGSPDVELANNSDRLINQTWNTWHESVFSR